MDAETLGLACALADLGIYKLADLIEHARGGVLNELVLTAVEHRLSSGGKKRRKNDD